MIRRGHHRITVLLVTLFVVLGSLPLGAVGMAAAQETTTSGGDSAPLENPTQTLSDDSLFKGTEDGQVVVWKRAFLPLRSNDTDAATKVPLPNILELQTLGEGKQFSDKDDGVGGAPLVTTFDSERNPAGVHNTGNIRISYDAARSGVSDTIAGEDNVDFIAARLTGSGNGFPEDYGDAVTLFGSIDAANENATFEVIANNVSLDGGTFNQSYNFDEPGQYVVYAVANNGTQDGFQIGGDGNITSVDGTVALVGADMVSVQQGPATVTPPSTPTAGENLTFQIDTSGSYDASQDGQMTHVVAVYKKDTFENSRFYLVVNESELGPQFDLNEDSQIEHTIVNAAGVADVEDGITINGVELSNGRVTRSVGLPAIIDRLAEDLETTSPATDPLNASDSTTINASVTGVTNEDRSATVTVETQSGFENGTYQYIVLSKPANNASSISTNTGTIDLAEQTGAEITGVSVNDSVITPGESVTVDVRVNNPTDRTIEEGLTLKSANETEDSGSLTLDPGEQGLLQLQASFENTGTKTLTVTGDTAASKTTSVDVREPTEFSFTISDQTAAVGQELFVNVNVTNNRRSTRTIEVNITGLPDDFDNTENVTVSGESYDDSVSFGPFSYDSEGTRSVTLGGQTKEIDVAPKTVALDLRIRPREVAPGDNVTFTVRRQDTGAKVDATLQVDSDTISLNQPGTYNFSGQQAGTYTVTATKSDTDAVSFENDTEQFTVLKPANVSLASASTPFDSVITSQEVVAYTTIENTGGVDSTETVRLLANDSDGSPVVVANRTVTVSGGGSRSVTLAGTIQGIDPVLPEIRSLTVQRANSTDNITLGTVEVQPALQITEISPEARLVNTNEPINITIGITNTGSQELSDAYDSDSIQLILRNGSTNQSTGSKTFSPSPGETERKTFNFTGLGDTGLYDLEIDRETALDENRTNVINVTNTPVYNVNLAANNTTVTAGDAVQFTATAPGETGDLEATLEITAPDGQVTTVDTTNGQATYTFDTAGTYNVTTTNHDLTGVTDAIADPGRVRINVQEPGDIQILDASVLTSEVGRTEDAVVEVLAANTGETPATENISIIGRENPGANQTVDLDGGERQTYQLNTSFTTTGSRTLEVTEASGDPVTAGTVQVTSALQVVDITVTDRSPKVGSSVTVNATVENTGTVQLNYTDSITRILNLSIGGSGTSIARSTSAFGDNQKFNYTAGEQHTISFGSFTFNDPGTRTVAVDDTDGGEIIVTRRRADLNLDVRGTLTIGEPVTFNVTTASGEPVDAIVRFPDRPALTVENGEETTTFDSSLIGTVTAVKEPNTTTYFTRDSEFVQITEPADLVVSSATVNTSRAFAGQSVAVNATIVNVGGSSGNATFSLNDTDTGETLATIETSTLAPGERKTITFTPELNVTGVRILSVNGTEAGTVFVADAVAITDTNVPSAVNASDQFSVDVTVTDRVSDGEAGEKNVTVSVEDQEPKSQKIPVDGNTTTKSFTFNITETGTYDVTYETDDTQTPVQLGTVTVSDTTVSLNLTTSPSPAEVKIGNTVTFNVTRSDGGPADATVTVAGQTLNTGSNGEVQTTIPVSGNFTATATKTGTTATAFKKDSEPVNVTDPINVTLTNAFGNVTAHPATGDARPITASQSRTVTINNTGGRAIALSSFGFTGLDADQYSITSSLPASVPAGGEETVTVTFEPTVRDSTSATLRFRTDTPGTPVRTVDLGGKGVAPDVTVKPTAISFGTSLQEGDLPVNKTVNVTNNGNDPLEVTPQSVEDAFTVNKTGTTIVQPGESELYKVTFEPATSALPASFGDVLQLRTNDTFERTVGISLAGTVSQGELRLSATNVDVGELAVDNTTTVDVVLTNTGTKSITVNATYNSSTNGLHFDAPSNKTEVATLAPGAQTLVTVEVNQTQTAASSSANLTFVPDGGADNQTLTVSATPTAPGLSVTPSLGGSPDLFFGGVPTAGTSTEFVTVTNKGDAPLRLTNIGISGPLGTPYSPTISSLVVDAGNRRGIPVQFNPQTKGPKNRSNLTFEWNDPSVSGTTTKTVELDGDGIETNLVGNNSEVAFGTTGVNSTVNRTISLTNDGNTRLNINQVSVSGTDDSQFNVSGVPSSLQADANTTISVQYTPSAAASHTATLSIDATNNQGGTSSFTAALQGDAVPPNIRVTDRSLAFGYVNNQTDATTTASTTIENTGLASTTLNITNVTISGNDAFTLSSTPGGAGEDAVVEFNPDTSDSGTVTATLTIESNDPDDPSVDVSLVGTATAPDATVNRSTVTFGDVRTGTTSATETVQITNEGGAPVNVTSTSLDSAAQFNLTGFTGTLVPGETATVSVRATPTSTGTLTTTLNITTNRTDDVDPVTLEASGVAPSVTIASDLSGDFGEVGTSSSATQTITIQNDGEATLVLDNISASGDAFQILGGQQTQSIGAGESTTLGVVFSPTAVESFSGTLSFDTNDAGQGTITRSLTGDGATATASISQSTVDFAAVEVDTTEEQELTLTNDGNAQLNVTQVTISGGDSSAFDVTGLGTPSLAPGASKSFNVSASPTVARSLTAQLRISTGQSTSDVNISLGATGVEPNVELSREQITFDRTRIGTSSSETVEIRNTGNVPLNVRDILLASNSGQFSVNTENAVIPAKGSRTVSITYTPASNVTAAKQGTQRSATLTVRTNDTDQTSVDVSMTARSKTPDLEIANVVRFGTLRVGQSTSQTLEVTNQPSATADISLDSLTLLGPNANEFSVTTLGSSTLEPGDSSTIRITASPTTGGVKTASLLVTTNDPRQSRESVSLTNSRTVVIIRYGSVTFDYNGVTSLDPKYKPSSDPKTGIAGIDPRLNSVVTDFNMTFSQRAAAAGTTIASSRPIKPVKYLDIATDNLDPSQHNETTVQFRVEKATIKSLGTTKSGIALYQYNGTGYEALTTSRAPSRDTASAYAYSATIDSFNDLAIGAGQARLGLVSGTASASNVPSTLASGDSTDVTITADVQNTGTISGSSTLQVVNSTGATLNSTTVNLAASGTTTESLTVTLTGPGSRTLTVKLGGTSQDVTIDINSPSGPSGPSGSTGDDDDDRRVSSPSAPARVTTQLGADGSATADLTDGAGISRVQLTIPGASGDVTVEEITDLPDGVPEPAQQRLATVDISAPNPTDGTATVQISLRSAALPDGVSPEELTISHYTNGAWRDLETTVVSSNGEIVLEAQTDSFSPFAVTYQQQTATPEPGTATPEPDTATPEPDTATPEPDVESPTPQPDDDGGFTGILIVILVIVALIAVGAYWYQQNN
ncbi:choice-of-anchor D domain-containing protein [Halobellus sp. EA9]|uniref:beta strand repeat-containing protein n=1 Tax=Halobellus sp. EA9 TaxID=3421647 RepID=UPI003EBAB013